MIAYLEGKIQEVDEHSVLINVQGIGYHVFVMARDQKQLSSKKGQEQFLYTYQYVRENSLELYGFLNRAEEKMFEILISISGIGPKGAMGILSAAPVSILERAIASGDTSILTRISGIGNKTAQKIIMELKDKFVELGESNGTIQQDTDVLEALMHLGYSRAEAQRALQGLPETAKTTQEKIKEALKNL